MLDYKIMYILLTIENRAGVPQLKVIVIFYPNFRNVDNYLPIYTAQKTEDVYLQCIISLNIKRTVYNDGGFSTF